ncbi:MAG: voltage-gated chloride channel protein, partial [Janthinobacterium sp.]
AVIADQVGLLWAPLLNTHHTHYAVPLIPALSAWTLGAMVIAGVLFGVTGKVFAQATHGLSGLMKRWISCAPLRPLVGGLVVAIAVWLI